jgi:hypothetical protein
MPLGAARLVSTPSRFRAWLGISSEAFPEFEQFYSRHFHRGTQVSGPSLPRLPIPPQGHMSAYSVGKWHEPTKKNWTVWGYAVGRSVRVRSPRSVLRFPP